MPTAGSQTERQKPRLATRLQFGAVDRARAPAPITRTAQAARRSPHANHGQEEGAAHGEEWLGEDVHALLHLRELHGAGHDAPEPDAGRGAPPRALPGKPRAQPLVRLRVGAAWMLEGA